MLPEELSLAESADAVVALDRLRIPVAEVIVNRVIPEGSACPICDRLRADERRIIDRIPRTLGAKRTLRFVPAAEREPRGASSSGKSEMLVGARHGNRWRKSGTPPIRLPHDRPRRARSIRSRDLARPVRGCAGAGAALLNRSRRSTVRGCCCLAERAASARRRRRRRPPCGSLVKSPLDGAVDVDRSGAFPCRRVRRGGRRSSRTRSRSAEESSRARWMPPPPSAPGAKP